jgi:hypothetical protein
MKWIAGHSVALVVVLVCTGCKQASTSKPAAPAAGPQTRATVITIRTTIEPDKKSWTHTLLISDGRARNTEELDHWRLFNTKDRSVTFVDDVARTTRTESFESLLKKHRSVLAEDLPSHYPRAHVTRNGAKKPLQGVAAEQALIEVGAYRRELWLGAHRAIPDELFAMMVASDSASSPLAPMMRAVDDALTRMRAFPLLDHAEVPYGKSKLVIDRAVISIAEQNVPQSMLRPPAGYRDVSVTKPPAKTPMK